MCADTRQDFPLLQLLGRSGNVTGSLVEFFLRLINVEVLEMEDVLFHLNSAVLMPERPEGESSEDGSGESGAQDAVTGISTLALVYRQFEFDAQKKMIIAGHTDTSGSDEFNFILSRLRAENILHLLVGDHENWCRVCSGRHKVEDYQQIIQYFNDKTANWKGGDWDCDPGEVDDAFGPLTREAINHFARSYNDLYTGHRSPEDHALPRNLGDIINNRSGHTWPEDHWLAIFNLYIQVLCDTLSKTPEQLDQMRAGLRFIGDDHRTVGCGESFPIDQQDQENYRSQQNRRVEILFFDENEAPTPENMTCPADLDRKHTIVECPLWNRHFFLPSYIPAGDLYAVPYHFRFKYFNPMLAQENDIPEGLQFRSFAGDSEIPTRTAFNDGLYTVIVQFPTQEAADADKDNVQILFETTDRWVHTENADATPTVVIKTAGQMNGLTSLERRQYYDLPLKWSSRNWRCKVGDTVDDWDEQVKTRTATGSPILFNLDDVVLTKSNGSQVINDRTGWRTTAEPKGQPTLALSKDEDLAASPPKFKSRVRILFVDPATNKLDIYREGAAGDQRMLVSSHSPTASARIARDNHNASLVNFQVRHDGTTVANLIKDPPGGSRVVVFCGEFYDVTSRRTLEADPDLDGDNGHLIGARAARLNDAPVHRRQQVLPTDPTATIHTSGIGDFELHYFHEGGADADHVVSYMVVYWSAFVTRDTDPSNGVGDRRKASDTEVAEFLNRGMLNAMKRWNVKEYQFQEHGRADGDVSADRIIQPFFFFEANEAFKLTPPAPALDYYEKDRELFTSRNMRDALRQARGGAPTTVAFITEEKKGSWVLSDRRNYRPYSMMSLRIKTRQDDATRFASLWPHTEFNDPGNYGCLVIAHEIGHATGQVDDYQKTIALKYTRDDGSKGSASFPNFCQFGFTAAGARIRSNNSNFSDRVQGSDPYPGGHDKRTLMEKNGPIRMRHVWRFAHWINQGSKTGGGFNDLLDGKQFEMQYSHPTPNLVYHRSTTENVDPWRFSHDEELAVGGNKTMHAYLYSKLDETRRHTGTSGETDFKAIVALRPLIWIRFRRNGGDNWNDLQKATWVYQFNRRLTGALIDMKFKLAGGGGAMDPALIRLRPGYHFAQDRGDAPDDYNFRIDVKKNSNRAIQLNGRRIRVGDRITARELVNFLFNKPAGAANFATADFTFVADWYSGAGVANGTFTSQGV